MSPKSKRKGRTLTLWRGAGACAVSVFAVLSCGGKAELTGSGASRGGEDPGRDGNGDVPTAGDGDATDAFQDPNDDCDVREIFERSCGLGSPCHLGEDSAGVNLFPEDLALSFVDVPALTYREFAGCPDPAQPELFINSEDLEASLFWTKLTGTQDCGTSMPIGPSLPRDEMACVYAWMEALVAEARHADE